MILKKYNRVHFVGIGGIGLSAIARLMLKSKKEISGSDLTDSPIIDNLKNLGAKVTIGHKAANLDLKVDLVIYSSAVPQNNEEIKEAERRGIKHFSFEQVLAQLLKDKKGIAVAGTNGKSTVTAMVGLLLTEAGFDPTVVVGSNVQKFGGNARLGQSEYVVTEACEYQSHLLELDPQMIVITNIEKDHLDYFRDLDDIIKTFQAFINKLDSEGILIINNDDPNCAQLKRSKQTISYGLTADSDLSAENLSQKSGLQQFDLIWQEKKLGNFSLPLPSRFNVYNALAAIALALSLDVKPELIKSFLADYKNPWRRFEIIGQIGEVPIISDYAHLPSSIKGTIDGAKQFYPGKRIIAVFQPHQHSRTKQLFKEFSQSFDQADLIILNEIYHVAGREQKDLDVSSKQLAQEIKKKSKIVYYTASLDETEAKIRKEIKDDDLLLIMGAGDIYQVADSLKS